MASKKAAVYARVSDKRRQTTKNQLPDLKRYIKKRGWDADFILEKESTRKQRPKKENLMNLCRQRKYDVVVVWRLDRFARSTSELINDVEELHALGVEFVSLKENIDLTTPSGKMQFHVFAAFAEFERDLIRDRVMTGLERAKAEGKQLGRPKKDIDIEKVHTLRSQGRSYREIAEEMGCSHTTIYRLLQKPSQNQGDKKP